MSTLPRSFITPEQYLELERLSEFRHEYYDGEMVAKSGAREAHNIITVDLTVALHRELRNRGCRAFVNDMRVQADEARAYTYPDVIVACGERRFLDDTRDTLLNPTVVFEVLSPSTERHDRTKKFRRYKSIESLRQHVLVAADAPSVEIFTRPPEGEWQWKNAYGLDESFELESVGCRVALVDIYEDVETETRSGADLIRADLHRE